MLSELADAGVPPSEVWSLASREHGWGGRWDGAVEDISERYGRQVGRAMRQEIESFVRGNRFDHRVTADQRWGFVLTRLPAPVFLDALELALQEHRRLQVEEHGDYDVLYDGQAGRDLVDYLNRLLGRYGVYYRFTYDLRAEWHGDEGEYENVLRPALDSLNAERLAGCRREFEAALQGLREATPRTLEAAVVDSGKAVESAMIAVLASNGVDPPPRPTASDLVRAVREAGLVDEMTNNALLAAASLRNHYGGHGAGEAPRELPRGLPELAVSCAAAAISYLAQRL